MSDKRERRCETCAAWVGNSQQNIGLCKAHSPDARGFGVTDGNGFCLVDYTPLDMMDGVPDAAELLTRILHIELAEARLLVRLEAVEQRAAISDGHRVKCCQRLDAMENRVDLYRSSPRA